MEHPWSIRRVRLPFQEHGPSQKIPVQDKQGPANVLCGTGVIAEHLYHMGNGLLPEPAADDTVLIMDLDGQRETEGLCGIAGQYTGRPGLDIRFKGAYSETVCTHVVKISSHPQEPA